jgi:hypothetical protein
LATGVACRRCGGVLRAGERAQRNKEPRPPLFQSARAAHLDDACQVNSGPRTGLSAS